MRPTLSNFLSEFAAPCLVVAIRLAPFLPIPNGSRIYRWKTGLPTYCSSLYWYRQVAVSLKTVAKPKKSPTQQFTFRSQTTAFSEPWVMARSPDCRMKPSKSSRQTKSDVSCAPKQLSGFARSLAHEHYTSECPALNGALWADLAPRNDQVRAGGKCTR